MDQAAESLNNPPVFIRVRVDVVTQYVREGDASALSTYVQKWCPDFLNATYAPNVVLRTKGRRTVLSVS